MGLTNIVIKETGANELVATVTLNERHRIVQITEKVGNSLAPFILSIQPEKGFAAPGTGHSTIENPIKPGNHLYPKAFADYLTSQLPGYAAAVA